MIPITLDVIYDALKLLFPREALIIIECITGLVVLKKDTDEENIIGTLGINAQGQLFVSEKFWQEHITDMSSLQSILLHELMHQVTHDTKFLFNSKDKQDKELQLKQYAANIAMDCRINAYIINNSSIPKASQVFSNLYTKELITQSPILALLGPNNSAQIPTEEMRTIYDHYYTAGKDIFGFRRLYELVLEWLKKNSPPQLEVFIGNHGELTDGSGNQLPKDVKDKIKDAIKDYVKSHGTGKNATKSRQAGSGEELQSSILNDVMGIDQKFNLDCFKRLSFDSVMNNVRLTMLETTNEKNKSIYIPSIFSRADLFKLIYGFIPPYWDTRIERHKKSPKKVPIYLDVSGSMWDDLPAIIELLVNVRDDLDYVWGFSNKVVKHTMEDLRLKKINSTGGTDFDCVIQHATENEFRNILVITDGYANCKETTNKLNSIDDVVVVLSGTQRTSENYFCKVYESTVQIEEVTE